VQAKIIGRKLQVSAALGVVCLALAVFGWGLQYKLSLYGHSGDHSKSIPHAKLLSQKERPVSSATACLIASTSQQARLASSVFLALFAGIGLAGLSAAHFSSMRDRAFICYRDSLRLASSDYFAFRPPPGTPFAN
jgi:hypothetical protein